jgi:hypothetical protein
MEQHNSTPLQLKNIAILSLQLITMLEEVTILILHVNCSHVSVSGHLKYNAM